MVTILHVDSDEAAQLFVQSALGKTYNLITAGDGPTAIQYCAMIQPDLILMNSVLPDIGGDELISRLKMFMPQTPIVVVTDNGDEILPGLPESSADAFLTKPVSIGQLRRSIQSLLPPPAKFPEIATTLPDDEAVKQFEAQIEALNQANKRLASLNAISALIGTSLDLEHLTDEILAQIHKTVNFDSATLLLLKGDILEAAASRGFTGYSQGMNVYTRSERNSAWRVVTNKLPLIIRDVTTSDYWESRPELSQIRSWLGVPLICKDRVVGVLTLDKNEPNAFTDADARYIFTLAYQIAIAVENAQLFEEWEDQATRLKLINEVAQEINTILNVDDLLEALAKAIFERLNYSRVAILEVEQGGAFLTLKAIYGRRSPQLKVASYRQPIHAGLIGRVVKRGRAILVNDTTEVDSDLLLEGSEICSELVVPVFGDNQRVDAVISVGQEVPNGFNDQDLWTVSSLASQAATAIENARLYHSLAQRLSDLAMLNEAGQALTSTIALDRMLSIVIERACLAVSAENGYVLLMESSDDMLTVAAATGSGTETLNQVKINPGIALINQVILEGEPSAFKRGADNQDRFADLGEILGKELDTVLITPLKTRRIIIGLVILTNQQAGNFDDNALNLINALSQLMVGAVENAQLFEQVQAYSDRLERLVMARTQRLQAIKKISQVVSQGLAVDDLLAVVGRDISQIFSPEFTDGVSVAIGLVDGSQISLRLISEYRANNHPQSGGQNGGQGRNLAHVFSARLPVSVKIDEVKPFNQVISQARPLILTDVDPQALYYPIPAEGIELIRSVIMAPLITGGKTIGLILVESQVAPAFAENDLETLETLAFQVASAIEHARLLQKTREIAIVEERTRLARDMHDGVAQNLAYLLIQVDRCLNLVEEDSKLETQLEQISSLLKHNIEELRRNIFDLRPVELEGKSLFRVLENFVTEFGRRWNLETIFSVQGELVEVSPEVESGLYRILQETLSNARRHAQCSQLSVTLTVDNRWISLEVKDDGQGFDIEAVSRECGQDTNGLGLISMRERVESAGGQLTIDSARGEGTCIFATLPL